MLMAGEIAPGRPRWRRSAYPRGRHGGRVTHVDAYVKRRDRAAGTVRRELGVLQAAINYAHKRGKLTQTVAVELPTAPPPKERWLTRDEAAKLIRASRKDRKARLYMPLFILIGIYTGRRKEAIPYAGRRST